MVMTLAIKLVIIAALIYLFLLVIFFMEREQRNVINEALHLTHFSSSESL